MLTNTLFNTMLLQFFIFLKLFMSMHIQRTWVWKSNLLNTCWTHVRMPRSQAHPESDEHRFSKLVTTPESLYNFLSKLFFPRLFCRSQGLLVEVSPLVLWQTILFWMENPSVICLRTLPVFAEVKGWLQTKGVYNDSSCLKARNPLLIRYPHNTNT